MANKVYQAELFVELPAVQTGCIATTITAASPEEAEAKIKALFDEGEFDDAINSDVVDWHYEAAQLVEVELTENEND